MLEANLTKGSHHILVQGFEHTKKLMLMLMLKLMLKLILMSMLMLRVLIQSEHSMPGSILRLMYGSDLTLYSLTLLKVQASVMGPHVN